MPGADLYAALPQARGFAGEMLQVDDDPGAEDVHRFVPQDAGGHEVHDELALFVYDGMAGVVAALIADHNIVVLTEQVHHAALALVAPVCSNN